MFLFGENRLKFMFFFQTQKVQAENNSTTEISII